MNYAIGFLVAVSAIGIYKAFKANETDQESAAFWFIVSYILLWVCGAVALGIIAG